jgi:hypothetical protein
LPSPCTEPKPPRPLAHTLNGLAASHAATSQACASAWRWPLPVPPRASAICWLRAFMNSVLLTRFAVPKSA